MISNRALLIFVSFFLIQSRFLDCAIQNAELAKFEKNISEKRAFAKKGIACSQNCLQEEQNNAACLYYQTVNQGLLLETKAEQYKTGIQRLLQGFQRVSELDPRYDRAGAFRALGFIYLKMPALPIWGGGLHRDLEKALNYANQALRLFPDDFENLRLKGEILLLKKDRSQALRYLTKALKNGGPEAELSPLIQKAKRRGQN